MDELKKLKVSILILFIVSILSIVLSTFVSFIEEDEIVDEFEKLSSDEQQVINEFYTGLENYESIYTVTGFMLYAVTGGLFLLLAKLWNMNKI